MKLVGISILTLNQLLNRISNQLITNTGWKQLTKTFKQEQGQISLQLSYAVHIKMKTIFMDSDASKTNETCRYRLSFFEKVDLKYLN